jgi:hypothetical protein
MIVVEMSELVSTLMSCCKNNTKKNFYFSLKRAKASVSGFTSSLQCFTMLGALPNLGTALCYVRLIQGRFSGVKMDAVRMGLIGFLSITLRLNILITTSRN